MSGPSGDKLGVLFRVQAWATLLSGCKDDSLRFRRSYCCRTTRGSGKSPVPSGKEHSINDGDTMYSRALGHRILSCFRRSRPCRDDSPLKICVKQSSRPEPSSLPSRAFRAPGLATHATRPPRCRCLCSSRKLGGILKALAAPLWGHAAHRPPRVGALHRGCN